MSAMVRYVQYSHPILVDQIVHAVCLILSCCALMFLYCKRRSISLIAMEATITALTVITVPCIILVEEVRIANMLGLNPKTMWQRNCFSDSKIVLYISGVFLGATALLRMSFKSTLVLESIIWFSFVILTAVLGGPDTGPESIHSCAFLFVLRCMALYGSHQLDKASRTLFIQQTQLQAAQQASSRILAALCDAVVHLDGSFKIQHPSSHLFHLLFPDSVCNPSLLEGSDFRNFIVSDDERKSFERLVTARKQLEGEGEEDDNAGKALQEEEENQSSDANPDSRFVSNVAVASNVRLIDSRAAILNMQIFHTPLECVNAGQARAMVGLRQIAIEESIASTTLVTSNSSMAPKTHLRIIRGTPVSSAYSAGSGNSSSVFQPSQTDEGIDAESSLYDQGIDSVRFTFDAGTPRLTLSSSSASNNFIDNILSGGFPCDLLDLLPADDGKTIDEWVYQEVQSAKENVLLGRVSSRPWRSSSIAKSLKLELPSGHMLSAETVWLENAAEDSPGEIPLALCMFDVYFEMAPSVSCRSFAPHDSVSEDVSSSSVAPHDSVSCTGMRMRRRQNASPSL
eukprot:gnl/MRDRNA2_/MRDRNA2_85017_c0_seq1.p1 gnl/MRDRNA2_/MRDRNA2_85017_c0~~gnl/MRDRNA2_/MRDRNA2_85017_c0_seq1.p1  ORF type:complete len:591 (-),score=62.36 gnl/MRDRNA2_/MRDRNA2_85017_c0_seq1:72-1781(-)